MRPRIAIATAVLLGIFLGFIPCSSLQSAQAQQAPAARAIISRIIPRYPELARPMRLEGTVKLNVMVAPNGLVKSINPLGGSPILLQAAQDAVLKWKWAPSAQETTELVELHFRPE